MLIYIAFPSPIQTLLSVSDLHRVHLLTSQLSVIRVTDLTNDHIRITVGWEFHPTPKEQHIFN
jgi:hypothetical protein